MFNLILGVHTKIKYTVNLLNMNKRKKQNEFQKQTNLQRGDLCFIPILLIHFQFTGSGLIN